jgi:hypothetical protein
MAIVKRSVGAKTFTCFQRLPTELRLLIWKHARPDPRIVRLDWSKQDPRQVDWLFGSYLECYNYSREPIPAMLHACAESRQVALEWYQLALPPIASQPRTYFDFNADYLYPGCGSCRVSAGFCTDCSTMLSYLHQHRIKRVLLPWSENHRTPFHHVFLRFRRVKELLIFDPNTVPLQQGVQIAHLKESKKFFNWQGGKDLQAAFLAEKDNLNARSDQTNWTALSEHWNALNGVVFHIEKMARVELAVTPETSRVYGFMKEAFQHETIDFFLPPASNC